MSQPLVKPSYKTCRFDGIVSFRAGTWNGKPHGPGFLNQIVENFRKFSSGPNAYYKPYVSINHKDELQSGIVVGAHLNKDGLLELDADDVPEVVGELRAANAIRQPSIEYFEPVWDESGKLVDGFRRPDGSIEPTPVLKALTLLGADSPAVKGLPDLPFAKHNDDTTSRFHARTLKEQRRRKYGASAAAFANDSPTSTVTPEDSTMDRAGMIAALQAMGMDTAGITDVVPDEVLKSFLEMCQKMQQPAAPATDATVPQMADATTGATAATTAIAPLTSAPTIPGMPTSQPSTVTLKFNDATAAQSLVAQLQNQWNEILRQTAAAHRTVEQQASVQKFADVTAFVTLLATPDHTGHVRIQPAQRAWYTQQLMKCDNVSVRRFSDGKNQGTELAESKAQLLTTLPKFRLGERMADPQSNQPGARPGGGGIDPDRRARMLGATPQGREILKAEKKTA
jgi:hypothetical protein